MNRTRTTMNAQRTKRARSRRPSTCGYRPIMPSTCRPLILPA